VAEGRSRPRQGWQAARKRFRKGRRHTRKTNNKRRGLARATDLSRVMARRWNQDSFQRSRHHNRDQGHVSGRAQCWACWDGEGGQVRFDGAAQGQVTTTHYVGVTVHVDEAHTKQAELLCKQQSAQRTILNRQRVVLGQRVSLLAHQWCCTSVV